MSSANDPKHHTNANMLMIVFRSRWWRPACDLVRPPPRKGQGSAVAVRRSARLALNLVFPQFAKRRGRQMPAMSVRCRTGSL